MRLFLQPYLFTHLFSVFILSCTYWLEEGELLKHSEGVVCVVLRGHMCSPEGAHV